MMVWLFPPRRVEMVQVAVLVVLVPVPEVSAIVLLQVKPFAPSAKVTAPPFGAGNPVTPVMVARKVTALPKVDELPTGERVTATEGVTWFTDCVNPGDAEVFVT